MEPSLSADEQGRSDVLDAVVVGAGFAGLYMLHKLRQLGYRARVFETGSQVGGTWFWNRYPGARCDVESLDYSYSFSDELEQEWSWTERYPSQPEILRYLNHVADRFDLRGDIQLETTVTAAHYDEATSTWRVQTDDGDHVTARYFVSAVGCLSAAAVRLPDLEGLSSFAGSWYHTCDWPSEGVDFSGRRVAVIGTGSSGVQAIPVIAERADELIVFQRTPNFTMPARNRPLSDEQQREVKKHYHERRELMRRRSFLNASPREVRTTPVEEVTAEFEKWWAAGGPGLQASFRDLLVDQSSNDMAAEFVRSKIREIVEDPDVAERLLPRGFPLGAKRLCVGTDYYETFNRDKVTLVDLRETPIERVEPSGIRTSAGLHEVDDLVFATGFDAMTGALLRIDIRGRGGLTLQEKWEAGPRTYLGISTAGFPNFFVITGPGSPSVLSTMVASIEQHVDWIAGQLEHMRANGYTSTEVVVEHEDRWVGHVNEVAERTLFPRANSWYLGANVPGKPRVFMPFVGGTDVYRDVCDRVAAEDYEGFRFAPDMAPDGQAPADDSDAVLVER